MHNPEPLNLKTWTLIRCDGNWVVWDSYGSPKVTENSAIR